MSSSERGQQELSGHFQLHKHIFIAAKALRQVIVQQQLHFGARLNLVYVCDDLFMFLFTCGTDLLFVALLRPLHPSAASPWCFSVLLPVLSTALLGRQGWCTEALLKVGACLGIQARTAKGSSGGPTTFTYMSLLLLQTSSKARFKPAVEGRSVKEVTLQ